MVGRVNYRAKVIDVAAIWTAHLLGESRLRRFVARVAASDSIDSTSLIAEIAQRRGVDLLSVAYSTCGILNYQSSAVSGESFLVSHILPKVVKAPQPVFFDIGANRGDYSIALKSVFPEATVHAFEPNPSAYQLLVNNTADLGVVSVPLGCGAAAGFAEIFTYSTIPQSSHAATRSEILTELHRSDKVERCPIQLTTLDAYCSEHGIPKIDFLKLDVEGDEYTVLLGSERLLCNGGIHAIQFEFNEMNVISRVFLRDFHKLLSNYRFFRLLPNRLLSLDPYNTRHEVFQFQNILAVHDGLADGLVAKERDY